MDQRKRKLKGVYLVPDARMMKANFGPSEHIMVGLLELKKYFDIELIVLGEDGFNSSGTNGRRASFFDKKNGFIGIFRDIKLLITSNLKRGDLINKINKIGDVDFIYERGQYLDFTGVLVAKELRIKHFYEVNWINFLGIKQFYSSWFNPIAKKLEEWSYGESNLNFFVGTQNKLISISNDKVCIIQNGIHKRILDANIAHRNIVEGKIKICFVANLMPHHRFDILVEALQKFDRIEMIELHCIGYYFEDYKNCLPEKLSTYFYGPLKKEELSHYLKTFNVGIISGGPSYSSFMKLFEYAGNKLAIICPNLDNLIEIFSDEEILFFESESANSLLQVLNAICDNKKSISSYGQNCFNKVQAKYTWENIYFEIAERILCKI